MKDVAHVTGTEWLGSFPEQGGAFYLGAEDEADEIHIRLPTSPSTVGVSFKELMERGLKVLPLLGQDSMLCVPSGGGNRIEITPLYRRLYRGGRRPQAQEHLDRHPVARVRRRRDQPGSGLRLRHAHAGPGQGGGGLGDDPEPSLPDRHRVWLRSVRLDGVARCVPVPAVSSRVKSATRTQTRPTTTCASSSSRRTSTGRTGRPVILRYKDGLFLPEYGRTTAEKLAKDALARQVFEHLVEQFSEQRRNVSHTPNANNYAPAVFAKEKKSKDLKLRKQDFEEAMRDLFNQGRIAVEEYGKASNLHTRLVRRPAQTHSSDRL